MARILYLHGLDGVDDRVAYLRSIGHDVLAPTLDVRAALSVQTRFPFEWPNAVPAPDVAWLLERPSAEARSGLEQHKPDILVGSSLGGAVAMKLINAGLWNGPTVLLAPSGPALLRSVELATTAPVIIIHGDADDVLPLADSQRMALAARDDQTIEVWVVHDSHRLTSIVADGTLGRAVDAVR